jgi:energy-converting hydrogenase Eha subunit G
MYNIFDFKCSFLYTQICEYTSEEMNMCRNSPSILAYVLISLSPYVSIRTGFPLKRVRRMGHMVYIGLGKGGMG